MADISKITLPNGNTYNIDAVTIDGRSVDTSISKSNPTENIPTTAAVIDYIEDQPFGAGNVNVVIESSAGNIFKNKNINTILTAKVYRNSEDITETATSFTWIKKNKDGIIDTEWSRTISGNTITITSEDILSKAVFECTVTLPD